MSNLAKIAELRELLIVLESRERHATRPVNVPKNDSEARRLCDLVLHDMALPTSTTTEIALAAYLLDKLGREGRR